MRSKFLNRSPFAWFRMSTVIVLAVITATAAMQSASAQGRDRGSVLDLPAASAHAAAPAAEIVSEMPFQKFVVLTCKGDAGSNVCRAKFAGVKAGERLVIQFASCIASTTEGGELGNINLAVTDAASARVFGGHFIAPTFRGGSVNHIHVASQPMLITIGPNQVLHLEASPNGGMLTLARCGLSGVKQKLG